MEPEQTKAFKQQLLARRAELLDVAQSGDDAAATVELDQTRQGRLSRMDALQGQAMSIAAKQRREQELKSIELALNQLAEGSYGICQSCEEAIAIKRLQADLTAKYCIQCAEKLENK